ncbi:E3 ubiquitin-protein ligase RBBP6-like [Cheilinus undulatus]|uniref:E3 ubiquitin-protein ligase RBBP6-like n=1 Tax=Cheilinus undulatus TaxID=241271 RepID=UPI001BD5973F|nr:E3 ubiquitin-protein ligase RBBP6-like [Cheilinus undulatus]
MTHVHYKFSSKRSYDTVLFDGPNITLMDLKRQIMDREKLRVGFCDLQITNAQTKQEYKDDDAVIPKGSSVIVRRIPIVGVKSGLNCNKTRNMERSDVQHMQHGLRADRAMIDKSSSKDLHIFSEMANLADANISEEEKIKAMLNQSVYDSLNVSKFGNPLPSNYTCYRCGNTGHHIRNCPNSKDKSSEAPVRIKKSTGIPRSFMVEVDDPSMKGAMLTNSGRYAIPAIDAEAYAIGKKEKPAFMHEEQQEAIDEEDPIPDELLCLICRDLLSDAVVIPCCGNSYCDDCIRTALLDSEDHICPTCSHYDVSPDTLIINKFLRQAVNTFKKEQGKTKGQRKGCLTSQSQNPTPTPSPAPTPPPLFTQIQPPKIHQPTPSQKDPLLHCSESVDTPPLSQESETPPVASGPASASNTPSRSPEIVHIQPETVHIQPETFHIQPETVHTQLEINEKAEEMTQDDSVAASPSGLSVSNTAAQSQAIPLVDQAQSDEQKSSSATWSDLNPPHLPPCSSVPSYPPAPPPVLPSPHFNPFPLPSGYPPGYPPVPPMWTFPTFKGAPIPPVTSTGSSIPNIMPSDWFMYGSWKKERSPHQGSAYRCSSKSSKSKSSHSYLSRRSRSRSRSKGRSRSSHRGSTHSRSSKSSKSKSSHSYPSSRSRSRSRSKSRSRPHSSSSRHRDHLSRSHSSQSYNYGYKRPHSPTTSSSSSPRTGYHSRHESSSDHRHHRKKSNTSSSRSRRAGEHREEGGSAGYVYPQYTGEMEKDQQRYLQWKREYKEWCEKYLESYLDHFHQLPPLPPCPFPWSENRERRSNHTCTSSRDRHQGRHTDRSHRRSPPSQSSSDSCSLSSQSSSSSSSKSSHSPRYTSSSLSHSSADGRSSPSQTSSDCRSTQSEDSAQQRSNETYSCRSDSLRKQSKEEELKECSKDDKPLNDTNLENLSILKNEKRCLKKHKQRRDDAEDKSKTASAIVCNDSSSKDEEENNYRDLESAEHYMKQERCLDKDYKSKSREIEEMDKEKGVERDKYSHSRKEFDRQDKEKSSKRKHRTDKNRHKNPKASDSRLEKNRKRKGDDTERRSDKAVSSKCLKTKEDLETLQGESHYPFEKQTQKPEKKKPLMEEDIWEKGIKMKPQKKISINIKLEPKQKEETEKSQNTSYSKEEKTDDEEEMKVNKAETETDKNKYLRRNQEEANVKIGEERQMWVKDTFKEKKEEMFDNIADVRVEKEESEYEELDKWSCEEKEKSQYSSTDAMEDSQREEVMDIKKQSVRGEKEEEKGQRSDCEDQERGELVSNNLKGNTESEIPDKENRDDLLENSQPKEVEMEERTKERDASKSRPCKNDDPDTYVDDGSWSSKGVQERKAVVKTLEEYTDGRSAEGEDELVLIQVPLSKWEKEESEDEEFQPSVSVSVTAETAAMRETERENDHQRERSVELERDRTTERGGRGKDREESSHRNVAPSSGRDRHDGITRDRERGRDRRKESIRSKVKTREGEKGREREHRRNLPLFSHPFSYPRSHDSGRREKHQGGDQGRKKSSCPGGDFSSGRGSEISSATKVPDENAHRTDKNMSQDSKFKDKERPCYSRERDEPSSKSLGGFEISKSRQSSPSRESVQKRSRNETKVQMNNVVKDNRENHGRKHREKEESDEKRRQQSAPADYTVRKTLEDVERPSSRSSSNSSSSSRESSKDVRKGREEARK